MFKKRMDQEKCTDTQDWRNRWKEYGERKKERKWKMNKLPKKFAMDIYNKKQLQMIAETS